MRQIKKKKKQQIFGPEQEEYSSIFCQSKIKIYFRFETLACVHHAPPQKRRQQVKKIEEKKKLERNEKDIKKWQKNRREEENKEK